MHVFLRWTFGFVFSFYQNDIHTMTNSKHLVWKIKT